MSAALAGRRIVNTRAAHQAAALDDLLRVHGAEPLAYPCIAIAPPEDPAPLDDALRDLVRGRYAWLLLTSANSVDAVAQRLAALGLALDQSRFRVAAVGPATAQAARTALRLEVVVLPERFSAEALGAAVPVQCGDRVLLPESALARPALADALAARGAAVQVVAAYRTVCAGGGVDVPRLLANRRIDAVIFTSSSTVDCFLQRLDAEAGRPADLAGLCIACIGPQTAATARARGLHVSLMPSEHTLDGLVRALDEYFARLPLASEART